MIKFCRAVFGQFLPFLIGNVLEGCSDDFPGGFARGLVAALHGLYRFEHTLSQSVLLVFRKQLYLLNGSLEQFRHDGSFLVRCAYCLLLADELIRC